MRLIERIQLLKLATTTNKYFMETISTKKKILKAIDELPERIEIEDAMEKLYLLYKVEKGITQADSGEKMDHQTVKERFQKWHE